MIKRQEIYDMYWYFAYERQNIFYNKLNGKSMPYTDDKILQEYFAGINKNLMIRSRMENEKGIKRKIVLKFKVIL